MSTPPRSRFGRDGEPCAQCGAPLAADQRYCLSCGTRRGERRVPLGEVLAADGAGDRLPVLRRDPFAGAPGPIPEPVRDQAGLARHGAAIGLAGVIVGAMLIGVLLGHWAGGNDAQATAQPAPQVISIGGGAPLSAAPAATTTAAEDTTTPTSTTAKKAASTTGSAGASTTKAKAATPKAVKALDGLSGKDYQKQVDKLPKQIGTGGKAPPKDDKAPAGGGAFEDIG